MGADDGLPELAGQARANREGARALALLRSHCTAQRRLHADEQRGLLCPLCTSPPRRCLQPDELFIERCADPRAPPLPISLYAHVLTALVCPWLRGSRRHRGRHVLRPLNSRMWADLSAVWAQREPHAQNFALHLLGVSAFGSVAACMLVFCPAVESCPCRAMSVRVRCVPVHGAVVHL